MRCVIWGEDVKVARGMDSVLLYIQGNEDDDASMSLGRIMNLEG